MKNRVTLLLIITCIGSIYCKDTPYNVPIGFTTNLNFINQLNNMISANHGDILYYPYPGSNETSPQLKAHTFNLGGQQATDLAQQYPILCACEKEDMVDKIFCPATIFWDQDSNSYANFSPFYCVSDTVAINAGQQTSVANIQQAVELAPGAKGAVIPGYQSDYTSYFFFTLNGQQVEAESGSSSVGYQGYIPVIGIDPTTVPVSGCTVSKAAQVKFGIFGSQYSAMEKFYATTPAGSKYWTAPALYNGITYEDGDLIAQTNCNGNISIQHLRPSGTAWQAILFSN